MAPVQSTMAQEEEDDDAQDTVGVPRSAVFVCMHLKGTQRNGKHTGIENYGAEEAKNWISKPSINTPLVSIGPFTQNADLFRRHWQNIRLLPRRYAFAWYIKQYVPELSVFVHPDLAKTNPQESISNVANFERKTVAAAVRLFDASLPDDKRVRFQRL